MTGLGALYARFPLPSWQPLAWLVMALLTVVGVWAAQAQLNQMVIASGVVVPQGKVRVVQHLEGGIVTDILVREGEPVTAGQTLVRLNLGTQSLNAQEIQVRLDGLRLQRTRLLAHVANVDLHMPSAEVERQPALAEAERAAYSTRRREHESNLAILRKQRDERKLELKALATRLSAADKNLALLRQQQEIATRLSASNLIPRMQVLDIEREMEQLLGEIAALKVAKPLAKAVLEEAEERIEQEQRRFRSEAAALLREVELDIARQQELLERARKQERRTEVASPVDGIVKNLRVNTLDGVIGPGEPIVDLVPVDETLVIEAQLPPEDVGHVEVGQAAIIKISTYDYLRYGGLEGRVSHIAADSTVDAAGDHYFRIFIETERNHLQADGETFPISAGMEAQVDIQIGTRSVMAYLVQPVLKLRSEAFSEP